MRLFKFINEKYLDNLEEEDFFSKVKNEYKKNWEYTLKNGPKLFRGDNKLDKKFYIYENSTKRRSNHISYNNILNILDSWKSFPKRTESIMSSTLAAGANIYRK